MKYHDTITRACLVLYLSPFFSPALNARELDCTRNSIYLAQKFWVDNGSPGATRADMLTCLDNQCQHVSFRLTKLDSNCFQFFQVNQRPGERCLLVRFAPMGASCPDQIREEASPEFPAEPDHQSEEHYYPDQNLEPADQPPPETTYPTDHQE